MTYLTINEIPNEALLFDELNKRDLWPKEIYNKLFYGLYYFKKYNIMSKNAIKLYECISDISIDYNKKFKFNDNDIKTDEKMFYQKYSFLNLTEIKKTPEILYSFKEIKSYNLGNINITLNNKENNIISIIFINRLLFYSFNFSNNFYL